MCRIKLNTDCIVKGTNTNKLNTDCKVKGTNTLHETKYKLLISTKELLIVRNVFYVNWIDNENGETRNLGCYDNHVPPH